MIKFLSILNGIFWVYHAIIWGILVPFSALKRSSSDIIYNLHPIYTIFIIVLILIIGMLILALAFNLITNKDSKFIQILGILLPLLFLGMVINVDVTKFWIQMILSLIPIIYFLRLLLKKE